ncbi:MAG TPA: phage portal protein, partial [Roseateles sp.]|nr:phage portal protein [Roseateles sp.]
MKPSRVRAALSALMGKPPAGLSGVDDSRGWLHLWGSGDGDLNTGDWQADKPMPVDKSLEFFAAYTCVTRPAADIAKLCLRLMQRSADGSIWQEASNPAYSPFLRRPNHFQTMQQFVECWIISKLSRGNTYALKQRDERRVVVRQYVLDPDRVTPLVAPDGSVFYSLRQDDLSRLPTDYPAAPASEIIHDRMNCLFHPLVGISPLYACALATRQGLEIQKNSAKFFENMSRPSGILAAPAKISDETAKRLKTEWESNFGKGKIGKVAVLGDGMKYEAMAVTPVNAELVKQLDLSAKQICAAFGMPFFMVGGEVKSTDNVQALWQIYYSQCLQSLIEAFERLQDDGLQLDPAAWRTEFDLDDLLRMDSKTLAEVEGVKVQRGIAAPNEARRKFNLAPAVGGETPYLQQQNFSLAALAKRDQSEDPFATAKPPAPAPAAPDPTAEEQ